MDEVWSHGWNACLDSVLGILNGQDEDLGTCLGTYQIHSADIRE